MRQAVENIPGLAGRSSKEYKWIEKGDMHFHLRCVFLIIPPVSMDLYNVAGGVILSGRILKPSGGLTLVRFTHACPFSVT